jgi:hypothetical protein
VFYSREICWIKSPIVATPVATLKLNRRLGNFNMTLNVKSVAIR